MSFFSSFFPSNFGSFAPSFSGGESAPAPAPAPPPSTAAPEPAPAPAFVEQPAPAPPPPPQPPAAAPTPRPAPAPVPPPQPAPTPKPGPKPAAPTSVVTSATQSTSSSPSSSSHTIFSLGTISSAPAGTSTIATTPPDPSEANVSESSAQNGKTVVGIVFGVLLGCAAIGVLMYILRRRVKKWPWTRSTLEPPLARGWDSTFNEPPRYAKAQVVDIRHAPWGTVPDEKRASSRMSEVEDCHERAPSSHSSAELLPQHPRTTEPEQIYQGGRPPSQFELFLQPIKYMPPAQTYQQNQHNHHQRTHDQQTGQQEWTEHISRPEPPFTQDIPISLEADSEPENVKYARGGFF